MFVQGFTLALMQQAKQVDGDQFMVGESALEAVVAQTQKIPAQLLVVHFADVSVQGD